MSWRLEQIVTLIGCRTPDLEMWIAEQWVRPVRDESGWIFGEAGLARAPIVGWLVEVLAGESEMGRVVMSVSDQKQGLRRQLQEVLDAIGGLPDETRQEIMRRLGLGQIS